ncbi:MAG: diaminopimelate decarboxylase, partial [Rhodospirillaceae bacterium]|nr:diaminopimelate decarboxylase [Rhodospirillaceae bacterium]
MRMFDYKNGVLHAEDVSLAGLADRIGTPFYCYSEGAISQQYNAYVAAFADQDAQVCYAMKANDNLAVLRTFAELGAGADVVSGGELVRALTAGIPPTRIIFSGVGKTADELMQAIDAGIMQINV